MSKKIISITVICTESNKKSSQSVMILVLFEGELVQTGYKISPEYGYSNSYEDKAKQLLINEKLITPSEKESLWRYCERNKIVYYDTKILTATKDMIIA